MSRLSVLFLCRHGPLSASTRYRCLQYLPYLAAHGFDVQVETLLDDDYLQRLYAQRRVLGLGIPRAYARRLRSLIGARHYDVIWIHIEAFPWVPGWIESFLMPSGVPYVVDYDDAVFHRYDQHQSPVMRRLLGKKIDRVMRDAALVVAGNEYIKTRARLAGAKRVEIIPTVVDLNRYAVVPPLETDVFTVGWIGSPVTAYNLKLIRPALEAFSERCPIRLVAVGSGDLVLGNVPVEVKPWKESTEVQEIQQFDVGIMPLIDAPFERGKNGFKLIQYMACARPVIASPVGVNQEIITEGANGFLAVTSEDWIRALELLKNDGCLRRRLGEAGRQVVEARYSLQAAAPKLAELLQSVP